MGGRGATQEFHADAHAAFVAVDVEVEACGEAEEAGGDGDAVGGGEVAHEGVEG